MLSVVQDCVVGCLQESGPDIFSIRSKNQGNCFPCLRNRMCRARTLLDHLFPSGHPSQRDTVSVHSTTEGGDNTASSIVFQPVLCPCFPSFHVAVCRQKRYLGNSRCMPHSLIEASIPFSFSLFLFASPAATLLHDPVFLF